MRAIGSALRPTASARRASTVLDRSMARVMGPTPPTRGDRNPATSATPSSTSDRSRPSRKLTPAATTAAPGRTMSAVMSPGDPAAATTTSAVRVNAPMSSTPVCTTVTAALAPCLRVSRLASGRPMVRPRPTITTWRPASATSWACSMLHDAVGCAGQRRRDAHDQQSQVDRMEAVGVLGRVHPQDGGLVVQPRRERVLDDEGVHRRVRVELVDHRLHLGLGGVGGEAAVDRRHAQLGAVPVLHGHVVGAGPVVAHQHGAQAGRDATVGQGRHAGPPGRALISAARASPSIIVAVTGQMVGAGAGRPGTRSRRRGRPVVRNRARVAVRFGRCELGGPGSGR